MSNGVHLRSASSMQGTGTAESIHHSRRAAVTGRPFGLFLFSQTSTSSSARAPQERSPTRPFSAFYFNLFSVRTSACLDVPKMEQRKETRGHGQSGRCKDVLSVSSWPDKASCSDLSHTLYISSYSGGLRKRISSRRILILLTAMYVFTP